MSHQWLLSTNLVTSFCAVTPSTCQTWNIKFELYIRIPVKNIWIYYIHLGKFLFLYSMQQSSLSLFTKGAKTPINFSLIVIASLPCTLYIFSRLQTFSKVFSTKKRNKLHNGAADRKIPIWTIRSFLKDDRKIETGNCME